MEMAFPLQPKRCPVTSAQGELGLSEPRTAEMDGEDTACAQLGPQLHTTTDIRTTGGAPLLFSGPFFQPYMKEVEPGDPQNPFHL